MEYVRLGKVIDAFSLDGTLKILSSSYFSDKRYPAGNIIYLLSPNNERLLYTVENYRTNKELDFVKLKEISSKEEALERKGWFVEAVKDESVLSQGDYYFSDLEECEVFDENNKRLGKVKKVEEFPAQITLRVARDYNRDFFVPFVKEFIVSVDINSKKIVIKVMEGML